MEPMFVEFANSLVWWAGSIEALDALSFCLDLECFDCVCLCVGGGELGVCTMPYSTKQNNAYYDILNEYYNRGRTRTSAITKCTCRLTKFQS